MPAARLLSGIDSVTTLPAPIVVRAPMDTPGITIAPPPIHASSPIVMGNHVYVQNPSGRGTELQERVMCLDTDTGKVIWEYKFNIYQSDVPPHRVGWASPAADVETGNVYVFGANGTLLALTKDGKLLWERSLDEEFNLFTTHGGRTTSPVVDGDLVIVKAASSTWGTQANRSIRIMAFDKRTGETIWVSTPGGRPFDTDYSQPLVARINGTRLLIAGLGDGGVHAIVAGAGEDQPRGGDVEDEPGERCRQQQRGEDTEFQRRADVDRGQQHKHRGRDVGSQQHVHQRRGQRHHDHQHAGDDGNGQDKLLGAIEHAVVDDEFPNDE